MRCLSHNVNHCIACRSAVAMPVNRTVVPSAAPTAAPISSLARTVHASSAASVMSPSKRTRDEQEDFDMEDIEEALPSKKNRQMVTFNDLGVWNFYCMRQGGAASSDLQITTGGSNAKQIWFVPGIKFPPMMDWIRNKLNTDITAAPALDAMQVKRAGMAYRFHLVPGVAGLPSTNTVAMTNTGSAVTLPGANSRIWVVVYKVTCIRAIPFADLYTWGTQGWNIDSGSSAFHTEMFNALEKIFVQNYNYAIGDIKFPSYNMFKMLPNIHHYFKIKKVKRTLLSARNPILHFNDGVKSWRFNRNNYFSGVGAYPTNNLNNLCDRGHHFFMLDIQSAAMLSDITAAAPSIMYPATNPLSGMVTVNADCAAIETDTYFVNTTLLLGTQTGNTGTAFNNFNYYAPQQ